MTTSPDAFFDYYCDRCGTMFCERVQVMNLALGYVDEMYCMPCLSQEQEMGEAELATFAKEYVYARDCFKAPWTNFNASQCPKIEQHQCFCQD